MRIIPYSTGCSQSTSSIHQRNSALEHADRHVVHVEPAESVVVLASDEPTMQMHGVRGRDWAPAVAAAQCAGFRQAWRVGAGRRPCVRRHGCTCTWRHAQSSFEIYCLPLRLHEFKIVFEIYCQPLRMHVRCGSDAVHVHAASGACMAVALLCPRGR